MTDKLSANEKISFLQKELAPIKGTSKYLTDLSEDLNLLKSLFLSNTKEKLQL